MNTDTLDRKVPNEIPADAYNLEVFAIKNSEVYGMQAYIGFKIPNGNFHFVSVPYTEPQKQKSETSKPLINYNLI